MRLAQTLTRVLLPVCAGGLLAQTAASVWDGIYTETQAVSGAATYKEVCASCHGNTLNGSGNIPPLAGKDFTSNWNGMTLGDLFDKMQSSMPVDRPGQLSAQQNANLLAYILQFNKFPAGTNDLPATADALKTIRFQAKK